MPALNSASVNFAAPYKSIPNLAYNSGSKVSPVIENDNQTIGRQPDYAEAYHNRGVAYAVKGEVHRAIGDFNTAIELNPDYAWAYSNRGVARQQR